VDPRFDRILILGNSGSGKSWLAGRLSALLGCRPVDLDAIHWEPGGYDRPREKGDATATVRREAEGSKWVIEGVYGWLAAEVVQRATLMVWLDLPVADCLAAVERRGPRGGATAASFAALFAWTADYPDRRTSSSRSGHGRLFDAFPAGRHRLRSRCDVERWLDAVAHDVAS
jgi:hypothetical protein